MELPGYTIEREIGRGGMARVYLAVQKKFGRLVAIKVVSSQFTNDPSFGRRFVREARIIGQKTIFKTVNSLRARFGRPPFILE